MFLLNFAWVGMCLMLPHLAKLSKLDHVRKSTRLSRVKLTESLGTRLILQPDYFVTPFWEAFSQHLGRWIRVYSPFASSPSSSAVSPCASARGHTCPGRRSRGWSTTTASRTAGSATRSSVTSWRMVRESPYLMTSFLLGYLNVRGYE